jgi:hypothetical protein
MKIISTACSLCLPMKFDNSQEKNLWMKGFCRIKNKNKNFDRLHNEQSINC